MVHELHIIETVTKKGSSHKRPHTIVHLYEMSTTGKSIKTERSGVGGWAGRERKWRVMTANRYEVFRGEGNNCVVCELYLNF